MLGKCVKNKTFGEPYGRVLSSILFSDKFQFSWRKIAVETSYVPTKRELWLRFMNNKPFNYDKISESRHIRQVVFEHLKIFFLRKENIINVA